MTRLSYHKEQINNYKLINSAYKYKVFNKKLGDINIYYFPIWEIYSPEMFWRYSSEYLSNNVKDILKSNFRKLNNLFRYFVSLFANKMQKKPIYKISLRHDLKYDLVCCFDIRTYREVLKQVLIKTSEKNNILLITNFTINDLNLKNITFINLNNYKTDLKFLEVIKKGLHSKKEYFKEVSKKNKIVKHLLKIIINRIKYVDIIYYNVCDYIFKFKIKSLTVSDISDSRIRLFLTTAKLKNVNRKVYQFGLIDQYSFEYRFHLNANYVSWSKLFSTVLSKHGIKKERIIENVHTRFKRFHNNDLKIKNKKIIFASTYTDKSHSKFYPKNLQLNMKNDIMEILTCLENEIIIKPHPAENENFFKKFNKDLTILNRNQDIHEYFSPGDLLVSFGSSLMFDAIFANLNSLVVSYIGWPFLSPIIRNGPFIIVENKYDLKKNILSFLDGKIITSNLQKEKLISYLSNGKVK